MAFAGGPKPAGLWAVSLFPPQAGLVIYWVVLGSRPRCGRAAHCFLPVRPPAHCVAARARVGPQEAAAGSPGGVAGSSGGHTFAMGDRRAGRCPPRSVKPGRTYIEMKCRATSSRTAAGSSGPVALGGRGAATRSLGVARVIVRSNRPKRRHPGPAAEAPSTPNQTGSPCQRRCRHAEPGNAG